MRARNLKPSYFTNEDLAKCPPLARLLFAGLWCLADRDGRLEDRPPRIKAQVLPYDEANADQLLSFLHGGRFITRYRVGDRRLIQITSWERHANPHPNEKSEEFPPPELAENGPGIVKLHEDSGNLITSSSSLNPSSLNPSSLSCPERGGGGGSRKKNLSPAEGFEEFWIKYPRREAKAKAVEAWNRIKPDPAIRERISAALNRQRVCEQWVRDGGRYIPLPATYLNQHRWEDEPTSPASPQGSGSPLLADKMRAAREQSDEVRRKLMEHAK